MIFWKRSVQGMALVAATLAFSPASQAAVVSVDWQTAGDNLITLDTNTGLNWLDLDVTANLSYSTVLGQLGTGGQFEGWRFATNAEVVALWANFNIDLSSGAPLNNAGLDTNIITASAMLGNTLCNYDCNATPYGTLGLTADPASTAGTRSWMGAYYYAPNDNSLYLTDGLLSMGDYDAAIHTGSYLVQASPVPVPAAVWLFGTGLIGLAGIARRKNHS